MYSSLHVSFICRDSWWVKQGGQKEGEGSPNFDTDTSSNSFNLDRPSTQRTSNLRSFSQGSSGSQHSHIFALLPFHDSVRERADVVIESNEHDHEKLKNISIKRLAYLNKAEVPILLLGSIAAAVRGVVFPIFGLLLSSANLHISCRRILGSGHFCMWVWVSFLLRLYQCRVTSLELLVENLLKEFAHWHFKRLRTNKSVDLMILQIQGMLTIYFTSMKERWNKQIFIIIC